MYICSNNVVPFLQLHMYHCSNMHICPNIIVKPLLKQHCTLLQRTFSPTKSVPFCSDMHLHSINIVVIPCAQTFFLPLLQLGFGTRQISWQWSQHLFLPLAAPKIIRVSIKTYPTHPTTHKIDLIKKHWVKIQQGSTAKGKRACTAFFGHMARTGQENCSKEW